MNPAEASASEMLVAFHMTLCTRDDVSAWVDVQVAKRDPLPDALLELTTLRGKHDVEIEKLLAALAPALTNEDRSRLELAALRELVRSGRRSIREAVRDLPHIAEGLPARLHSEAVGIEDQFILAELGTYGTVEDAERAFLAFLEHPDL
jgi:hypothetical protein